MFDFKTSVLSSKIERTNYNTVYEIGLFKNFLDNFISGNTVKDRSVYFFDNQSSNFLVRPLYNVINESAIPEEEEKIFDPNETDLELDEQRQKNEKIRKADEYMNLLENRNQYSKDAPLIMIEQLYVAAEIKEENQSNIFWKDVKKGKDSYESTDEYTLTVENAYFIVNNFKNKSKDYFYFLNNYIYLNYLINFNGFIFTIYEKGLQFVDDLISDYDKEYVNYLISNPKKFEVYLESAVLSKYEAVFSEDGTFKKYYAKRNGSDIKYSFSDMFIGRAFMSRRIKNWSFQFSFLIDDFDDFFFAKNYKQPLPQFDLYYWNSKIRQQAIVMNLFIYKTGYIFISIFIKWIIPLVSELIYDYIKYYFYTCVLWIIKNLFLLIFIFLFGTLDIIYGLSWYILNMFKNIFRIIKIALSIYKFIIWIFFFVLKYIVWFFLKLFKKKETFMKTHLEKNVIRENNLFVKKKYSKIIRKLGIVKRKKFFTIKKFVKYKDVSSFKSIFMSPRFKLPKYKAKAQQFNIWYINTQAYWYEPKLQEMDEFDGSYKEVRIGREKPIRWTWKLYRKPYFDLYDDTVEPEEFYFDFENEADIDAFGDGVLHGFETEWDRGVSMMYTLYMPYLCSSQPWAVRYTYLSSYAFIRLRFKAFVRARSSTIAWRKEKLNIYWKLIREISYRSKTLVWRRRKKKVKKHILKHPKKQLQAFIKMRKVALEEFKKNYGGWRK